MQFFLFSHIRWKNPEWMCHRKHWAKNPGGVTVPSSVIVFAVFAKEDWEVIEKFLMSPGSRALMCAGIFIISFFFPPQMTSSIFFLLPSNSVHKT